MTWVDLPSVTRTLTSNGQARATLGARPNAKGGKPKLILNLSIALAEQLGWKAKQRLRHQMDAERGLMRFHLSDTGAAIGGKRGLGTVAAFPPHPGMQGGTHAPEVVEHHLEAGWLVVKLPAWACVPQGRAQPLAPRTSIMDRVADPLAVNGRSRAPL